MYNLKIITKNHSYKSGFSISPYNLAECYIIFILISFIVDILSLTQTSRLAMKISKYIYRWLEVIVFCLIAKNEHPLTIR